MRSTIAGVSIIARAAPEADSTARSNSAKAIGRVRKPVIRPSGATSQNPLSMVQLGAPVTACSNKGAAATIIAIAYRTRTIWPNHNLLPSSSHGFDSLSATLPRRPAAAAACRNM